MMRMANTPSLIPKEVSYPVFYFKIRGYYDKGLVMLTDSGSKQEKKTIHH